MVQGLKTPMRVGGLRCTQQDLEHWRRCGVAEAIIGPEAYNGGLDLEHLFKNGAGT
jgi:hypothetical protein